MEPTQQKNGLNASREDMDEVVPIKRRKLSTESDADLSFEGFSDDGSRGSNVSDGQGERVTNVLDDIFNGLTEERPTSSTCRNVNDNESIHRECFNKKQKVISNNAIASDSKTISQQLNGASLSNKEDIHPPAGEALVDTTDASCSVHNLTFTSDTQEYSLVNDSQADIISDTDLSKDQSAILDDLDKVVSANDEFAHTSVIVLDDSSEGETSKTSPYAGSSKNVNNSFHEESPCNCGNGDASHCGVKKIPSLARDAKIIASIVPDVNYNIIYNKLLQNREDANRLDIVTASVLEEAATKESNSSKHLSRNSIIEDVRLVVKQFPAVDADLAYAFLESIENESDRVERTIKEMGLRKTEVKESNTEKKPNILKKDSTLIDDPILANDPLFNDMRKVAKVFPNRDRNEIYALLEAHVGEADRIQIVINELLHAVQRNNSMDATKPTDDNSVVNARPLDLTKDNASNVVDVSDNPGMLPVQEDVEHLQLLFPDCDPNYLFEKMEAMKDVNDKRNVVAAEMFEKKNYPKLKDRLDKEKVEEEKRKKTKRNFTVEEFLNKFPEPQTTFGDPAKPVSDIYKAHAQASMQNDFLMFKVDYLTKTLAEYNHHYYVTAKKVFDVLVQTPVAERRLHRRFMKSKRKKLVPVPPENDEYFFHEHWFTHNELKIEDYKKQKEADRQAKVEEARENGELYECCCCYDDECLFEDLANCPEGHLFCKVCVVRSTEAAFGEMKTRFPCLTGECDQDIPLSTLQGIIPPNMFSKIVSRLQEEEVLQAQIPDLVTCPFCPFATIMPDPDDKVLKCLNPECLKESCRLCREDSHIPLKCNEVESRAGVRMRTYIENKVAEAVMRKCHKCGKKFLKDSGCNKMTCVCGATSCYFCKEPNIDYTHFNHNTKCAQTQPDAIHDRDMKEAAKKAMEEYILEHPEAADLDLQSDLKDVIQNYKGNSKNQTTTAHVYENDDVDDDDDDDEDDDDETMDDSDSDDYVGFF